MKVGSKMALHWNKDFQPGMAYVMLSRTQVLNDIHIIESKSKFSSDYIKVNADALEENNRIHDAFEALKKEKDLHNVTKSDLEKEKDEHETTKKELDQRKKPFWKKGSCIGPSCVGPSGQ